MRSSFSQSLLLTFIAVICIGLVLLGNWQVRRLAWKTDLIERVTTRVHAEPTPGPELFQAANITSDQHEYLRVRVEGEYQHELETLVWAATEHGTGYWLMTPLKNEQFTVLINRGYIPLAVADGELRRALHITGTLQVTGLLRLSEPEGGLLRKNIPVSDQWYSRDVEAIGQARGLKNNLGYFIDAEAGIANTEWPRAGLTRIQFRNHHLIYALTWYGLAVLLASLTLYVVRRDPG